MSFLINPFTFAVAGGDFEAISSVTVGSGGAASVEFTSIGTDWQHLQIRFIGRVSTGAYGHIQVTINSSVAQSAWHNLQGSGSSVTANGYSGIYPEIGPFVTGDGAAANIFGAGVIDLLDYGSTTKTKVFRSLDGYDRNGVTPHAGYLEISSHLFDTTAAVTSVKLSAKTSGLSASSFVEHSTFALYGVKAP